MADIFDISIPIQVNNLLPDSKRTQENKPFLKGLLSAFTNLWNFFLAYKRGADLQLGITTWSAGTYTFGTSVIDPNSGAVYRVRVASTTTQPSISPDWELVLNSFIGVDERQNFSGSYMSLTYALNRQYGTSFFPDPDILASEIYLEPQVQNIKVFRAGATAGKSSSVGKYTSKNYVMNDYNFSEVPAFIIKVPGWRFPTFGATDDKLIRSFVDQYLPIGINYFIEDY